VKKNYHKEIYEDYIHKSRYARYLPAEHRRETWEETVSRYMEYINNHLLEKQGVALSQAEHKALYEAILSKEIMPSMRALMTAGPALERDNVAGYNCAYVPIDDRRAFDEIMYILMCGTGVGFSVERKFIKKLPVVADEFFDDSTIEIHVADSRIGWATAYRKLVSCLYDGFIPVVDLSSVRPAGARLKTFGGRSSGPEPLQNLIGYTIETFKKAKGRKLNELECHDLVCKIAEVIVCGGVRRSALLSLGNLTSERLRKAKSGQWYYTEPHRALANNSVCYTEHPDIGVFLTEWTSLIESKSGERGIFSRYGCERSLPSRREGGHDWGTNPCSEIVLRPRQFCNLTEVIARPEDTHETLRSKVVLATILGTLQSVFTDFRYLGKRWKDNCEEERLLGVSLTGIMDCPILHMNSRNHSLEWLLEDLRRLAVETNENWAKRLGIPQSAAVTCVKPSGTVSQLVGSSSGIHPRYAEYYVRRVRNDIKDPMSQVLIDYGVPYEVDNHNPDAYVFEFPMKAEGSVTVQDLTAVAQLELWQIYNKYWCEHKPSVSIYVSEDEWLEVGAWVYENFDDMSGVSFFPYDDHVYPQAPYEEITEDEYNERLKKFETPLDFNELSEDEDVTTSSQELACAGGACEL
jgi:ribonucleoside-diphosphate reductase alpha chain